MDIKQVVTTSSNQEFIRSKNVIVGTSRLIEGNIYLANANMVIAENNKKYIPSLFKILDEILVNSIDHFINCILRSTIQHKTGDSKVDRFVNLIRVVISDDGSVMVANDGYGIPIVMLDDKYLPEVLFTKERTGTNMGDDNTRITGGTNGIGATTICAFSKSIVLTIHDEKNTYKQIARLDNSSNLVFRAPVIGENKTGNQFTVVSFNIDWAKTEYKTFGKNTKSLFINYLIKRLIQTSLYTRHVTNVAKELKMVPTNHSCPSIKFDDMLIDLDFNDEESINKTFNLLKSFTLNLVAKKQTANPLSASITLIIGINSLNGDKNKYKEISVINGVEVLNNPIAKTVKAIISKTVKVHCEQNKMSTGNIKVKDYITIALIGCVPDPQWIGQVKEGLTLSKEFISNYDIRDKCNSIKDVLAKIIYELITNEKLKKRKSPNKNNILTNNNNYIRCLSVDDGKRDKNIRTRLFICEGSSASTLISNIRDKGLFLNSYNTGILSAKGVITNVYHKMNWYSNDNFEYIKRCITDPIDCKLISTEDVESNSFIQMFIAATNLNENKITDKELLNRLYYDEIVCATDSDYDGWNIAGLIFVLLSKWKALFDDGRVKILHLPIIRIIPNNLTEQTNKALRRRSTLPDSFIETVKYWEFFTMKEYNDYIKENTIPSTHVIKYYKGLGTTDKFFHTIIAKNPEKYIYTIAWDSNADKNLELFYGKTKTEIVDGECVIVRLSDKRKELLSTGVRDMTPTEAKYYKNNIIAVSTFLNVFVKQYFLDNVQRKLLKIVDGLNNVGTKINYALPSIFGPSSGEQKVNEVGPRISGLTGYHHGEASINKSVQGYGQQFTGAVMFPILLASGEWGTRYDGGEYGTDGTAAAPRYIYCKLNNKFYELLHPKSDFIIYEYQEDEGLPIEPKYLLPVLPTISFSNYATTAHGWKITVWARSFKSVSVYVLSLLQLYMLENGITTGRNGINADMIRESLAKHEFDIEPRNYDIKPIRFLSVDPYEEFFLSKGQYKIETSSNGVDYIYITALPIGVWIKKYVESIRAKIGTKEKPGSMYEIISKIDVLSRDFVNICITMHNGWRAKIAPMVDQDKTWLHDNIDDVEYALHLYVKIYDEINILNEHGKVVTYNKHHDLINDWFKIRLEYYVKRIRRQAEFIKVEIMQEENKLRYLSMFSDLGIKGKTGQEFDNILANNGFIKFRSIVKNSKKHHCSKLNTIPNERIIDLYTNDCDDLIDVIANLKQYNIVEGDLKYKYLKDLKTGSITIKGIEKVRSRISELKKSLNILESRGIEYRTFMKEVMALSQFVETEFM